MRCDETVEVRPAEVHPLDRIDQTLQREVKPSSRVLAKRSVRPPTPGSSPQPPTMRSPGVRNQEDPQASKCGQKYHQTSVSTNVAMYLTSAEQYLGKFTMTAAKQSATLQAVGNLRKDRPRQAKKHAKGSK
jgi:hypothetical protein